MNRIQMLRLWHRDGCKLVEHARHVLHDSQTWILYRVYDPQGTRKFGNNFVLYIIIDGRTDTILGSEVIRRRLREGGFISQDEINTFEAAMRLGCTVQPESVANLSRPIKDLNYFMQGAPLPATAKGPYEPEDFSYGYYETRGTGTTTSFYPGTFMLV
jgi:hypothetical protein